jgi:hypothetical protein
MAKLNLIKTETAPIACGLIEALEVICPEIIFERTLYGDERCLSWYLENPYSDLVMRIVFDPENKYSHKIGHHTVLDQDEYELADRINEAFDDGFETIFIHVKF